MSTTDSMLIRCFANFPTTGVKTSLFDSQSDRPTFIHERLLNKTQRSPFAPYIVRLRARCWPCGKQRGKHKQRHAVWTLRRRRYSWCVLPCLGIASLLSFMSLTSIKVVKRVVRFELQCCLGPAATALLAALPKGGLLRQSCLFSCGRLLCRRTLFGTLPSDAER